MPEADPEDRDPAEEPAAGLHAVGRGGGIAGAVAEEDAVVAGPEDLGGGGRGRVHRGLDPGGGELFGRLVLVAAVGDEHEVVGADDEHRGRPGEPRQVPDVGQVRDDEGVDPDLGKAPAQPRGAAAHVHRRQVRGHDSSIIATAASTARR